MKISSIAQELSLRTPVALLTAAHARAPEFFHRFSHKFIRNRGRLQSKACVVAAVLLFVFFMATGLGVTAALPGLSGGQGLLRDSLFMARMSAREESRYVRTLAALLRDDPRVFLRMVEADIKLLLDEPELRRNDGAFAMWQYRTDSCVLDLYLSAKGNRNKDGDAMRVVDYEVRMRDHGGLYTQVSYDAMPADAATCLSSVMAATPEGSSVITSL